MYIEGEYKFLLTSYTVSPLFSELFTFVSCIYVYVSILVQLKVEPKVKKFPEDPPSTLEPSVRRQFSTFMLLVFIPCGTYDLTGKTSFLGKRVETAGALKKLDLVSGLIDS